jgi:hypothetical protein
VHRKKETVMRPTLAALAAGFIGLGFALGAAKADAVKVSPHLTVFGSDPGSTDPAARDGRGQAFGGAPTVIRGSASRRGPVHDGGRLDVREVPLPVGAGATLWLTDPETGDIIACEARRGSGVGSRYIHCFGG